MKTLIIISLIFVCTYLNAQSIEKFSIDNGGTVFSNSNIELIYTIGEVNVSEITIGSISLSEGFINPNTLGALNVHSFSKQQISIYPNPASKFINIMYKKELDKAELYNLLGKKVISTNNSITKIDVSQFQSGIYLLKVYSGEEVVSKKIIIK